MRRRGRRSARARDDRAQAADRRRDRRDAGQFLHAGAGRGLADAAAGQRIRHRQRRVRGAVGLSQGDGRDGAARLDPDASPRPPQRRRRCRRRGRDRADAVRPRHAGLARRAARRPTPVASWLRFHTGCPIVADPAQAHSRWSPTRALPPLRRFALGTPDYPDRSTTLILQVASLTDGATRLTLSGPGIRGTATLRAAAAAEGFRRRSYAANRALFPRGVDLLLVAGNDVAALPRTTIVARA